ncbi:MAG: triose-phosphate isomerase [Candidatus Doudnabacteria bacterium]|nr:triose-phosphate isomerase [Candidatus Doudnabacteria bacterium]
MKIIIANWKLNPQTIEEARSLASQIEHGLLGIERRGLETAICPPFVFLPAVRHAIHFAHLGAQNVAAEESGPFTGEISVGQLREFKTEYVIVGHSERRAMGEDDKLINRKLKLVLKHKLEPILCVGAGTKKEHSNAAVKKIVKKQLGAALAGLSSSAPKLTIAYEPVWAISRGLGTGQAVTPAHAAEIIGFIKSQAPKARVIYGGSVDSKNASGLAKAKIIEGALVGGASLKALEFLQIIKAFSQ